VSSRSQSSVEEARELGLEAYRDNRLAVASSDLVIVAVEPSAAESVLREVSSSLEGKILVSTVAKLGIDRIRSLLGERSRTSVFRAMPNINVEFNKGFTALAGSGFGRDAVSSVFRLLGDVVWVEEELLDVLTVVASCTPALVAEIMDAVALAALRLGVPKRLAMRVVARVFEGTAISVAEKGVYSVRNSITTPRGLTSRMLLKALENNVKNAIVTSILEASRDLASSTRSG